MFLVFIPTNSDAHSAACFSSCYFIIVIVSEYLEAGPGPLFPSHIYLPVYTQITTKTTLVLSLHVLEFLLIL